MMVSEHRMMPARLSFPCASANVDGTPESPQFAGVSPNASSSCCDSPTAARARQSKILDRWEAKQARGIIASTERQAHEAELSALTTNVRASSLIQMWRGMEADGGGGTPTTAMSSCGEDAEAAAWDAYVGEGKKKKKKVVVVAVRCDVKEVVERGERQRKEELQNLAGVRAVSRFPYRKRIQAFLRFKSLRRDVVDKDQTRSVTTTHELDQLQRGFTIMSLRRRFSCGNQQEITESPDVERDNSFHMQFSSTQSLDSEYSSSSTQQANAEYQELATERELHVPPPEERPPHSESEEDSHEGPLHPGSYDLQEGSQNSDAAWEEGSLEMSNIDWERSIESSNHLDNERQTYRSDEIMHLASSFPSPSWVIRREAMYNDLLETYADNAELRELLERRSVSTSLASDFRVTLDQLIMSALRRQGSTDESSSEYEYEMFQGHNLAGSEDTSQDEPSSFSLVPVPSFQADQNNSVALQTTCSSHCLHHIELRSDIARMNQEMHELRQMFRSCMEKQDKFLCSVKQDVTDVLHNLAHSWTHSVGTREKCTSEREASKKGNCCICHEKEIDSLLYRCGHMCTCFRCAHELQWNSGRCPICRAPIVDVVRAYPLDA